MPGAGELVIKGDRVSLGDDEELWRSLVVMVAQQRECSEMSLNCMLKEG